MPAKRTKEQSKKTFLDALTNGYSVTGAAQQAGWGRTALYQWRQDDPEFATAWDSAWESRGDWYEDRNRDEALKGNMAAILNGLRIHGRIVERKEVTGNFTGAFTLELGRDEEEEGK